MNNNNNNNINNNENLFWKIYRNKYLNNQIYYQLLNMNIEYNDYKHYKIENRIKYSDINSLEILIEKDLSDLLLFKLNRNGSIYITRKSIKLLLYCGDKEFCSNYYNYCFYSIEIYKNLKSILNLLLNKEIYRNLIDLNYFLEILIKCENIEILEWCIGWCIDGDGCLQSIIKVNHIIDLLKNYKNLKFVESFFKFICPENLKYEIGQIEIGWYLSGKDLEKIRFLLITNEKYKISIKSALNRNYKNSTSPSLFSINQEYLDVYNKLIELNYFSNLSNFEDFKYIISNSAMTYESKIINLNLFLLFFKIYFKCVENDKNNQIMVIQDKIKEIMTSTNQPQDKEKQLFKLLINLTKNYKLYSLFYFKYYEFVEVDKSIPGSEIINKNCIKFKKLNSLNILSKLNDLNSSSSGSGNNSKDEIIEFLISFLNEIRWNNWEKNYLIANKILELIFKNLNSKDWYEKLIEKIKLNCKLITNYYLPIEWNENLNDLYNDDNSIFIIKDISTVDWLTNIKIKSFYSNIKNPKFMYYKKREKDLIKFENNQIRDYTILKLEYQSVYSSNILFKLFKPIKIDPIKWSQILNNPITPLILKQCKIDFNSIINENYQNQIDDGSINTIKLIKSLKYSKDGVSQIPNYYNFKPILIKHLVEQVCNNNNNSTCETSRILSKIKINDLTNNDHLKSTIKLLVQSILDLDLYTTIILFNSIDDELLLSISFLDQIKIAWNNLKSCKKVDNNILIEKVFTSIDDFQIIDFIKPEIAIEYLKYWLLLKNKLSKTEIGKEFINFLFKKLLIIKGITINQVAEIRELLINNNQDLGQNILNETYFHSFYYLFIKSLKLIKYLLMIKRVVIQSLNDKDCSGRCPCHTSTAFFSSNELIKVHFGIDYKDNFNFNFIYNQSFETILNYLISIKDSKLEESSKFISKSYQVSNTIKDFKHSLTFYLEINRIDLFFNLFENNEKSNLIDQLSNSIPILCFDLFKRLLSISNDINFISNLLLKFLNIILDNGSIEILNNNCFIKYFSSILILAIKYQKFEIIKILFDFYLKNYNLILKTTTKLNLIEFPDYSNSISFNTLSILPFYNLILSNYKESIIINNLMNQFKIFYMK